MAKKNLPVNYKDDVMSSAMGAKRRWQITQNTDGTYNIEDVTTYDQVGSEFGAGDINATNQAVNESFDKNKMISDMDELDAVTQSGYGVDALLVKEVNESLRLDFSNARYDVQDVNALLQNLLDKFYPKGFYIFANGVLEQEMTCIAHTYGSGIVALLPIASVDNNYVIVQDGGSGSSWTSGITITSLIDLGDYATLRAVVDGFSGNAKKAYLCVFDSSYNKVLETEITNKGTYELNVASLSGNYYVGFYTCVASITPGNPTTLTISEFALLK